MKFICGECKTKYTISDEKVRGKVLKVKCKKCDAVVEVREVAGGVEAVAPVVSGKGARRTSDAGPAAEDRPTQQAPQSSQPSGRPRTASLPPPPPPEALAYRAGGRPPTGGPKGGRPAPAPVPSPAPAPVAAPRAISSPSSSGVRPAARPASFLGQAAGSSTGSALAGSLAEALESSVAPDDEMPAQATVVSPLSLLEALGADKDAAQTEWFVAIRDEPVGPITKAEIQARASKGDVNGSSLVWREGMDDWRPLRDVHSLGDVLRGTGRASLPATPPGRQPLRQSMTPLPIADRSVGSVATPIARSAAGPAVGGGMFPKSTPASAAGGSGSLQIPIDDIKHPAAAGKAIDASGIPGAVGLPPPPSGVLESTSVDQFASIVPAKPVKKLKPIAWVGIFGAAAFGITLALGVLPYVGSMMNAPRQGTENVRIITLPGEVPPPDLPAATGQTPRAGPENVPSTPGTGHRPGPRSPGTKAPPGKGLSAADAELLARMQREGLPTDRQINVDSLRKSGSGASGGGSSLTADQIRSVVGREKRSVQQCYERAMRGASQARDIRVTVTASVGPSGSVTSVRARGAGDAGMQSCIEGAVRRWRFPAAAGPSNVEVPVVFTANER